MIDKKKVFKEIAVRYGDGSGISLPDFIAEKYEDMVNIKRKISICNTELIKAEQKLQNTYASIRNDKRSIQKTCQHWSTTYHPDASGNNDSETICDICGASL